MFGSGWSKDKQIQQPSSGSFDMMRNNMNRLGFTGNIRARPANTITATIRNT
jgi:hypothetical protein